MGDEREHIRGGVTGRSPLDRAAGEDARIRQFFESGSGGRGRDGPGPPRPPGGGGGGPRGGGGGGRGRPGGARGVAASPGGPGGGQVWLPPRTRVRRPH